MGKLYALPEEIQDMIHDYLCKSVDERSTIAKTWEHYLEVDWTLTYDEQFNNFEDYSSEEYYEDIVEKRREERRLARWIY